MTPAPTAVDVIAAQLLAIEPDWLHARAAFFDEANARIADIADGFRSVLRDLESAWRRYEDGGAPPTLGPGSAAVLRRLDQLQSAEPATALRRAADSLAQAQAELRELRAQRAAATATSAGVATPHPADERAVAVYNRVARDFVETGARLLALPLGLPGDEATTHRPNLSTMELSSASALTSASGMALADDTTTSSLRRETPPGGGGLGGLGSSLLSSLPDSTNPPGGQPMMPFMPMGMGMGGMGSMGQTAGKDRQPAGHGSADAAAWREADEGWEVVGRGAPDARRPSEVAERAAHRAIDELLDGLIDPVAPRRKL